MDPRTLPVYQQRERILDILKENQVIVVESPTGSGKTTQLPIILHEAGYDRRGVIGITQPRRIAAVSVSSYIQRQLEKEQGPDAARYTAFKMRFIDETGPETRIKIMTDGILLQEIKADPYLSRYSVIMIDEAHERSLNIDFILGLLKRTIEVRPDLKIIISSATINAEVFSEYFNQAPVVRIDTQTFPVTTVYAPPAVAGDPQVLIDKIVDIVGHVLDEKREGDMLIFLSGEKVIKDCIAALYSQPFRKKLHIVPLYGRLSKEEQDEVFPPAPQGKVKVVVATNIAETSITIDGVTTVIDSGLAKMNFYNPRTYTSSLIEKQISRASANQRRGRAGRTQPGTCYRLYPREEFDYRPLFTQEEIYRTDLSEVVLRMAELGITDFESFDFISSPGRAGIASAVETLLLLNALDENRELSEIGRYMARFPLLPRHSRMIVESMLRYPDVLDEVLIATSFLTSSSPFLLPQGEETEARNAHHHFRDAAGDFVSYLKIYQAFMDSSNREKFCARYYLDEQIMGEIANVRDQLSAIVSEMGMPIAGCGLPIRGENLAQYICSLSRGLIQFICFRTGRSSYQSLTAERIEIHPGSVMFREAPDFLVAGEIVKTSRTFARSVSPIRQEWLQRISPELSRMLISSARGGKKSRSEKELRRMLEQKDAGAGQKSGSGGLKQRKIRLSSGAAETLETSGDRGFPDSGDRGRPGSSPPAFAGQGAHPSDPSHPAQDAAPAGRDSSWQVSLGGEIYDLKPWKGKKKILELEWGQLAGLAAMKHLDLIPQYQDIRLKVRHEGRDFLAGERLGRAIRIARNIGTQMEPIQKWPKNGRFSPWEDPRILEEVLDIIMSIAETGRKGGMLGFLTLHTDSQGLYWLRVEESYQEAVSQSLASLESLVDDVVALEAVRREAGQGDSYPGASALKEKTGRLYRQLSTALEQI